MAKRDDPASGRRVRANEQLLDDSLQRLEKAEARKVAKEPGGSPVEDAADGATPGRRKTERRPGRSGRARDLLKKYGSKRMDGLDPAQEIYEGYLLNEIDTHLDQNPERLRELARIRDVDWVSPQARSFLLPSERERCLVLERKRQRRARVARVARLTLVALVFLAALIAIVAGVTMTVLSGGEGFALVLGLLALCGLDVFRVVRKPDAPQLKPVDHPPTPEALMMQRFLQVRTAIGSTQSWNSDSTGRLDLDLEHDDVAGQLRQMENLSNSMSQIKVGNDPLLQEVIDSERARLDLVRMSLVDRLAAMHRYRVSLEQVDIDAEREAKFRAVDEIRSGMDSLEVGRASSEFSISQRNFASEQLDRSRRVSRQLLEELQTG